MRGWATRRKRHQGETAETEVMGHELQACQALRRRQNRYPGGCTETFGPQGRGPTLLRIEEDEIRIISVPAGIKRAQAIARKYVPGGVSLVDELIAERRAEAARE